MGVGDTITKTAELDGDDALLDITGWLLGLDAVPLEARVAAG